MDEDRERNKWLPRRMASKFVCFYTPLTKAGERSVDIFREIRVLAWAKVKYDRIYIWSSDEKQLLW